jgi:putative ABC transport system permease protein
MSTANGARTEAAGTAIGTRAGPGRRAVARWAWRLFRREWRQQLLVLTLVTVAVTAAVALAALAVTGSQSSNADFGDAQALAHLDAKADPAAANAAVDGARARFGAVEVIGHNVVEVPGSVTPLDLRAQDPHGRFGQPLLALRQGRYPTRVGEVALTNAVADLLSVGVGDRVQLGRVDRTVVALVENPSDLSDHFALIAPSQIATAENLTLLFDLNSGGPEGVSVGQSKFDAPVEVRGDPGPIAALVLVATTLALALVGLIAAAGFLVVAQRRQRQLGMLAALGATERHLRLVMVANGAIVGTTAALIGGVVGVLGWIAAAPTVETGIGHRIDRFDLPWAMVAGCLLLAVAMSTTAAWWPARSMARMPVTVALSGRPSRPRPVHRSLAVAAALLALGVTAIYLSNASGKNDDIRPPFLIAGMVAVIAGVILVTPATIRLTGAVAGRLPFAPRLALRDLSRYQARTAAALAAITLGIGISVGVVALAAASTYRADEGNLSSRQLLVLVGDTRTGPDASLSTAERTQLDANAAKVATSVGGHTPLTLEVAMNPSTPSDPNMREPITLGRPVNEHTIRGLGYPVVATPELLQRYAIEPASIRPETDVLTAETGNVSLMDFTSPTGRSKDPGTPDAAPPESVQHVSSLSTYTSAPQSLITEAALDRHGWVRARSGWLIETDHPLTSEEIAAARSTAATAGLQIETRASQDDLAALETGATVVGALLALAIVAMAIGLIRGEAVRDLRTLTATGADGRTRRNITASTAGALALLGVVLGTGGAYIAMAAGYRSHLDKLTPLPLAQLVPLAIAVPAIAAVAGWLLAGREPRSFARQGLD